MFLAGLLFTTLVAGQTLTRPPVLESVSPPTPPSDGISAPVTVELSIVIDVDGRPSRIDVVDVIVSDVSDVVDEVISPALRQAYGWQALGTASTARYRPAEVDGAPAVVEVKQTIQFGASSRRSSAPAEPAPAAQAQAQAQTQAEAETTAPSGHLHVQLRAMGSLLPLNGELYLQRVLVVDEAESPGAPSPLEDHHHVVVAEVVVSTNDDGSLLQPLAAGRWHLEVSSSGHESRAVDIDVDVDTFSRLEIVLRPRSAHTFETVVRGRRGPPPISQVSLGRAEVTGIPGTFGDTLRVIESLPGVARAPLLGGALMVRGGLPGHSQVMVEGVPVPTLYHFGGLRSVINSAFVDELQFMPGGFPVRYGNATAGVVNITTNGLREQPLRTQVTMDALDTGVFVGGTIPLSDQSTLSALSGLPALAALPDLRFGVAARRSHLEVPAELVFRGADAIGAALPFVPVPSWSDWQVKLESDVSPDLRLTLFAFGADDDVSFLGPPPDLGAGVDTNGVVGDLVGNHFKRIVAQARFRPIAAVTHLDQVFIGDAQRGLLADGALLPLLTDSVLTAPQAQQDWGLRDETQVRLLPWWQVRVGLDVQQGRTQVQRLRLPPLIDGGIDGDPSIVDGVTPDLNPFLGTIPVTQLTTTGTALWADTTLSLGRLEVVPGVRVEWSSIHLVDEDPIYDGETTATVHQVLVDPRLSLRYRFGDLLTVKGAFGLFHQRPALRSVAFDVDGLPLPHPAALQLVMGFESILVDGISLDVQVYASRRQQLTRDLRNAYLPGGAQPAILDPTLPDLGSFDGNGSGHTEGIELMLRAAPSANFFGWIAYTVSRTTLSLGDRREVEVPSTFDQTHNLVVVGKVVLPWSLVLGGRFAFVTGNPGLVPDVLSSNHDLVSNDYTPVSSSLQPSRLAPYHRLDMRLDRAFFFNAARVTPYLEVLNVYNWLNPEVVIAGGDFRGRQTRVLLPGPPLLPFVGLEVSL